MNMLMSTENGFPEGHTVLGMHIQKSIFMHRSTGAYCTQITSFQIRTLVDLECGVFRQKSNWWDSRIILKCDYYLSVRVIGIFLFPDFRTIKSIFQDDFRFLVSFCITSHVPTTNHINFKYRTFLSQKKFFFCLRSLTHKHKPKPNRYNDRHGKWFFSHYLLFHFSKLLAWLKRESRSLTSVLMVLTTHFISSKHSNKKVGPFPIKSTQ